MNKTQLNYFEQRVRSIKHIQISKVQEEFPLLKELSLEEKAEQIHIGNARFILYETIQNSGGKCPYISSDLSVLYHIPKVQLIIQKNSRIMQLRNNVIMRIEKHAAFITDKYVIMNKSDCPEILQEFENMNFITEDDKNDYALACKMEE